jgi:type II secretion system protein G
MDSTLGGCAMSPQYQAPVQQVIVQQAPSNGLGTAGFVISLIGFLTCGLLCPLGLLLSFFGILKPPRGLAIAGTILGGLGSLWLVLFGFAIIAGYIGLSTAASNAAKHEGLVESVFESSKVKAAKAQISAFEGQIDIYQLDVGSYPTTQQGLAALRVAPPDLPDPVKWQGPYARKEIPPDRWGNPYHYESRSPRACRVYSAGPDGATETNDDVVGSIGSQPSTESVTAPASPATVRSSSSATHPRLQSSASVRWFWVGN